MAKSLSRRELIWLGVVVTIGLVISVVLQHTAPLGQDVSDNSGAREILVSKKGPERPAKNADLTLVVFTDYQCPACKLAHPAMERAVEADGHVRVLYRDLPIFGPVSEKAARVAVASDFQGIYPAVHRLLMDERRALTPAVLRQAVEAAGGDWNRIERDLIEKSTAIDLTLARNQGDAFRLNIVGTPAYLAGPYLVSGAMNESEFRRAFALGRDIARKSARAARSVCCAHSPNISRCAFSNSSA